MNLEFNNLQKLKVIKLADDYWRVVLISDGVRHLTDKSSLEECFTTLHADRTKPDFQERLNEFKVKLNNKD